MTDEHLYQVSASIADLAITAKELTFLNAFRYRYFVDNGERGYDCAYARMSRRHLAENIDNEIALLKSRLETYELAIAALEGMRDE